MGVSSSNQLPAGHKSLDLGEVIVSRTEVPTPSYWNAEPRVILANNSDYIVSYWVIEEDKKRTKAQRQRVARSIGRHLSGSYNDGTTTPGSLPGNVNPQKEEDHGAGEEGEEEDVVYFLTRDHRMGRKGSTQPTKIPFPVDCQHVRVIGYFERDGEWLRYKDKVYSIALRNKNFRITATTSNITTLFCKKTTRRATQLRGK